MADPTPTSPRGNVSASPLSIPPRRKGRVPIARINLLAEPARLALALVGISFALFLMFLQIGFRESLFSSCTSLYRALQGEVFILDRATERQNLSEYFSDEALEPIQGYPEVTYATGVT